MTIEEAIKELIDASHREAKYGDTNNHYYEIMMRIEAFDMAIKALETQPCEDCISREDAKNLFLDGTEGYDCRGFTRMEIGEMLDNLPSVTSTITDVENNYDIGYNCGYADAMFDIAEGSEDE